MTYRSLLLALLICLPAQPVFAGDTRLSDSCDLKDVFAVSDKKDFMEFDAALRAALKSRDVAALALMVNFPLKVGSPDDTSISIDNATTLQHRFDQAFPQAAREAVLNQDPGQFFCKEDWLMYSDRHAAVDVEQVAVGTAKEFRVSGVSLMDASTGKLPAGAHRIEFICHTPKYRILVDSTGEDEPRYRAWIKPHATSGKPDMEIDTGTSDVEGSGMCGRDVWTFKNGNTQYQVGELGCTDGSEPKGSVGSVEISTTDNPDHPIETLWCYQ